MANEITKITDQNGVEYPLVDVLGREATVDLMKDTTGWLGGNELPNNLVSGSANHVNYSVKDNKSVEIYTDAGGSTAQTTMILVSSTDNYKPKAGQKILSVSEVATAIQIVVAGYNGTTWVKNLANTATYTPFTIDYDGYDRIGAYLLVNANNEIDHKIAYPMITTPEQYALNPAYRPYHDTVEAELAKKANAADVAAIAEVIPSSATPSNKVATAEDVTATVDLLKDTTGWLGGNKWKNDVRTASVSGVTGTVNDNEQIVLTGAFTGAEPNVILFGRKSLKKGTYKITGNDGSNDKIALQVYKAGVLNVYDYGDGGEFTLNADTSDILLRIYLNVGATISDSLTMSPMLLTSEEYAISPLYRPSHESVEEMLFYKAGDEVQLNGLGFAGFVTNGSTELHVAFTLSKIIKATNVSLVGQLTVRGLNGYVLQSKQISELTVSVEKIAENVVMIILKNTDSSAFNVTNNTPLFFTFELQTAKLTFTA